MFPSRFFADRYFAPRYFPPIGAAALVAQPGGIDPTTGGPGAALTITGPGAALTITGGGKKGAN